MNTFILTVAVLVIATTSNAENAEGFTSSAAMDTSTQKEVQSASDTPSKLVRLLKNSDCPCKCGSSRKTRKQ